MKKQSLFALATLAVLLWAQQAGAFSNFPAPKTTVCDFMGGSEWVINFTSGNTLTPSGAYTYTSYSREVPTGTNTYFIVKTTPLTPIQMQCGVMLKRKTEAAYPGAWNRLGMARSTASGWYLFDNCTADTLESCGSADYPKTTVLVSTMAHSDMKTVSGSGAAQTAVNPVSFSLTTTTKQGTAKITGGSMSGNPTSRLNKVTAADSSDIVTYLAGKRWAYQYNADYDSVTTDSLSNITGEMLVEWNTSYLTDYCPHAYPFQPFYYFLGGTRSDGKYVFSYRYRPVVKVAGAGANSTYEDADYYEEEGPAHDPMNGSGIFTKSWAGLSNNEFRIYGTNFPGPATNSASDFNNTYGVAYAKPCETGIETDSADVLGWTAKQYSIATTNNSDVCPWTAVSNDSWITVDNASGTGTNPILYTVAANDTDPPAPRSGTITVNARSYTITATHCKDHSNCVYPDNADEPVLTPVSEAGSTFTVNQPVPESPYPLCADLQGTWTMHYDGSGFLAAGDYEIVMDQGCDNNLGCPAWKVFNCYSRGTRTIDSQPIMLATSSMSPTSWAYYENWYPDNTFPYNDMETPDFTGRRFTQTHPPVAAACGQCNSEACGYGTGTGCVQLISGLVSGCQTGYCSSPLVTSYADADNDTYGNAAVTTVAASAPAGYVTDNTDCNDSNAAIHPGASDATCDGIDENCNSQTDEGYVGTPTNCGVGACAATGITSCSGGSVHDNCTAGTPSTEICGNNVDDNCNGATDESCITWYRDSDSDTYGDSAVTSPAVSQPSGYVSDNTDCDDTNGAIYQNLTGYADADMDNKTVGSAVQVCSGASLPTGYRSTSRGNDCNDADATKWQLLASYVDADNDTYGAGSVSSVCSGAARPAGYSATSTDCNDSNASINPGMVENSSNGIDDNCNGVTDEAGTLTDLLGRWTINKDNGTVYVVNINTICNSGQTCLGSSVSGMWAGGRVMGAREGDGKLVQIGVFASAQNDWAYFEGTSFTQGSGILKTDMFPCAFAQVRGPVLGDNFHIASGVKGRTFYRDADSDTYGNAAVSSYACTGTPTGYVTDNTDCNDSNAAINPVGDDANCNGVDENCDGITDGDYSSHVTSCGCAATGDSSCVAGVEQLNCTPEPEICGNNVDDDCNGATDECTTWYRDSDADTYGDSAVTSSAATQPSGYVSDNTDCDDTNIAIYQNLTGYADADMDNKTVGSAVQVCSGASLPTGYRPTSRGNDCDDTNAAIYQLLASYVDADNDTYGAGSVTSVCSGAARPTGYSATSTDCNDSNSNINPGKVENSSNGIDDNCNGVTDEAGTLTDLLGRWTINKDNGTVYVVNINTICNSGQTCLGSSVSGMWAGGRVMGAREGDGKLVQIGIFASAPNEWAYFEGTSFTQGSGILKTDMFPCAFAQVRGPVLGDNFHIASGLKGRTFYLDADNDTYGNAAVTSYACTGTPTGYVTDNTDCNDSNAAINPVGDDANCNGIDENCDGNTDGDYASHVTHCGIGACAATGDSTCAGGVEHDNCTAGTPAGSDTTCDGIDDDCNGLTDDGYTGHGTT